MEQVELCGYVFPETVIGSEKAFGELILLEDLQSLDIKQLMIDNEGRREYSSMFDIIDFFIDKAKKNPGMCAEVFKQMMKKIEEWHRLAFPGRRFGRSWHEHIASQKFNSALKLKTA